MLNIREDLFSFLNEAQLKVIEGLCWILNAVEEFIFALTDFSFINEAYYEMLESYRTVGIQIIIALTIGYALYAMLLKPTDMSGIIKNVIFASVVLSSFGSIFNLITVDVGSNIANSLAPQNEQFIFSQSILKYSVRDYSNPDNDYYFDFTNKSIHDVETDKFLKNDVVDESGKIIAKKGDLQYPVLIFSGLVYGIVLLTGLLIVSIITTKNIIEIFISGIVGIFAISFNIGAESKFFRNYISIMSLTLGKIIANIVMLTLYAMIVKTISTSVVSSLRADATVSFVIEFVVNCSMIWVILSGSDIFKKTFGIDLGLSDVAAGNLQSSMFKGLAKATLAPAKAIGGFAGKGIDKSKAKLIGKATSERKGHSPNGNFKNENADPFINENAKQTTDAQEHKENHMGIDTNGAETKEMKTSNDNSINQFASETKGMQTSDDNSINQFASETKGMQTSDDNNISQFTSKTKGMQTSDDNNISQFASESKGIHTNDDTNINQFASQTNKHNHEPQGDSLFRAEGINKRSNPGQVSEKDIKYKSTDKNPLGEKNSNAIESINFRNDIPTKSEDSKGEFSNGNKKHSKTQQHYKLNKDSSNPDEYKSIINNSNVTNNSLNEKIKFNDTFSFNVANDLKVNNPFETEKRMRKDDNNT